MISDLASRIDLLAQWMNEAKKLVVFTGAGIGTDSGIPDYRGPNGVWTRRDKGLTTKWPDLSLIKPNDGHHAIFELQEMGKLKFLISQNIDNLHLASGIRSELLAELHGNYAKVRCRQCETVYDKASGFDGCIQCGGELVSSVVNFGQSLPYNDLMASYGHSQDCDLFLVVGSSLVVTPAAEMPKVALQHGAKLVIINQGETPYDTLAHLRFDEKIGEVLRPALDRLKELMV